MDKSEKIIIHADMEIEDLIPDYLGNQKRDVVRINLLVDEGDFESVQRIGHSMKGSGGGYGFDEITEIGGAIEQAARDLDGDSIKVQTGRLSDYLERVEVVYDP